MSAPLLVHLLFHPASAEARDSARALHRALNDDPVLPGLSIPTVVLAEDGTSSPPATHDLNEAEHSVVILLADDNMVIEQPTPEGRLSWGQFAAELAENCADGHHRFGGSLAT